jgi:hypothetical protein
VYIIESKRILGFTTTILITTTIFAGMLYYVYNSCKGCKTKHKSMVWLEANDAKFSDVMAILEYNKHNTSSEIDVQLRITPEENRFATLFRSWNYIIPIRIVLPLLFGKNCANTHTHTHLILPQIFTALSKCQSHLRAD